MKGTLRGLTTLAGRIMLTAIFVMSAVGNKIPQFSEVTELMATMGVPAPSVMLAGAIVFLIAGGVSVAAGLFARAGAALLLVFLVLATYYFHDFWTLKDDAASQEQMIHFMKNVALAGAMLIILARGSGEFSADQLLPRSASQPDD